MMHLDNVQVNLDGSMTLTLTEFMSPVVGATFQGATVSGSSVHQGGGAVLITVNVTPGAPIVQQTIQADPGGSAVVDG